MNRLTLVAVVVSSLGLAAAAVAADPPFGVVVASAGDAVLLVDPASGGTRTLATGPVGLLFPAPGGLLFAPDVIHGTTTVVDLRLGRVAETLPGVTMPWFGALLDRYLAFGDEALMVSYPERAVMFKLPVRVANPFQIEVAGNQTAALVLARRPDRPNEPAHLIALDLTSRTLAYDIELPGQVVSMHMAVPLGLVFLTEQAGARIVAVDPSTQTTVVELRASGSPVGAVTVLDGRTLAVAERRSVGGKVSGALLLWKLDMSDEGLVVKKAREVALPEAPVRLAADPSGRWLAIGLESGAIAIVDSDKRVVVAIAPGSGPIRDLRWCDPSIPGPPVPAWSDEQPQPLDFSDWTSHP